LARGLHTLKGSAATLGLEELADFAHRMEDVILPLRGSAEPLPAPLADAVLRSLDLWMSRLRAHGAKSDLPDLSSGVELLAGFKNGDAAVNGDTAAARLAAQVARAPEEPDSSPPPSEEGAGGESWRVSTRQV